MKLHYYCWLLAGLTLAGCAKKQVITITVKNTTELPREKETVEIPWQEVAARYAGWTATGVIITDAEGFELPSQVLYGGDGTPRSIIFQASAAPGATSAYMMLRGAPAEYARQVFGRFVPERYDDFAWENALVAFRVYGPALEATGEISNGIDAWVKSSRQLVLDDWYATGDYHRDHGHGLDCYKVGRTLGAGAMAPLVDGALVLGNNFMAYNIVDQGPLRLSFELTYAPYAVGGSVVTERRLITLDANSRFNRVEERYENAAAMDVAAGIVLREGEGTMWTDAENGVVAYWEPRNNDNDDDNGHTAVALLFPSGVKGIERVEGHLAGIVGYAPDAPCVYYAGTGWSKGGIETPDAWQQHVADELTKLKNPLEVEINK
ncbi:MAG: DUF4861 domain-containing protein [Odoribacteraceae bacterium]|jgi:hypothetical protein|nr:DUF4861 domain-containing protein [Odoribacteraceae bacterium]